MYESADVADGGKTGEGLSCKIGYLNWYSIQPSVAPDSTHSLNYPCWQYLHICTSRDMSTSTDTQKKSQNVAPRRPGPVGYVKEDMAIHLQGEIPAFRVAQAAGKLDEFWPAMHTRFSAIFKIVLTAEEIAQGIKMEDKLYKEFKVHQ